MMPPTTLTNMAMGYFRSRTLCAAARLLLADALAAGPQTVTQLAQTCTADPPSLHRLLRALASFGIVTETEPALFALTALGQPLRKDVPNSEWASIIFWSDLLADNWAQLTECIRTGDKAATIMESAGIASRWSTDPNANAIFRAVMGTAPAENYAPIASSWDFAPYATVADLGGGGGSLLIALLQHFPHLKGMLVDRPESIENAAPRFLQDPLLKRCQLIAADLAEAVPSGADVYILKHVLHGCRDPQAVQILKNCHAVLPPNGRVLVVEFVLPEVVNQPSAGLEMRLMSDLNMLTVTGGKERSEADFSSLFEQAGLKLVAVTKVNGDPTSIVEAVSG